MLQHKVGAVPIEERSRWAPPVQDDSDCDYEVMYHDHTMDPPPSAGLAAPGPPTPALLPSPPHAMEEFEVEYTPLEPPPCASVQSVPLEGWGATMYDPDVPPPEWSEVSSALPFSLPPFPCLACGQRETNMSLHM